MTLITQLNNRLAITLSAQLRLNAWWSIVVAYGLGLALSPQLKRGDFFLDLLCLLALSILSALWNNWQDRSIDEVNRRTYRWDNFSVQTARLLLVLSIGGLTLTGLLDWYRLVFVLAVLPLGYLYNSRGWSGRPYLSLGLYSLYYRAFPFALGWWVGGGNFTSSNFWLVELGLVILKIGSGMYKDLPDQKGDKVGGKQTFVLQVGVRKMAQASFWMWLIGISLIALGLKGFSLPQVWVMYSALALGFGLRFRLFRQLDEEYQLQNFTWVFRAENLILFSLLGVGLIF